MSLRQKVSVNARQKSNFYLLDQVTVLLGLVLSGQFARFLIPDVQNGWYLSVWASSGLFVFFLMRKGDILFPGLWLGGFLGNWLLGYSPFDALGFASGELLAAWISLRLLYRWAPDWRSLAYKTDFLLFLAFPVGLNGVLAGAWGLFWQQMFYQGPWHLAPALLLSNSCAVSFGVLLLGTNLLSWQKPWSWQRLLAEESSFWFFSIYALVATAWLFWQQDSGFLGIVGLLFVLFMPMLWALTRFPADAVYRLALLVFLLAMAATAHGLGPYSGATALHPITVLQIIGIGMISMGLFAAAMIAEAARNKESLRQGSRWLERRVEERTLALRQSQQDLLARERFIRTASAVNRLFSESLDLPEEQIFPQFCEILQRQLHLSLVWVVEDAQSASVPLLLGVAGPRAEMLRSMLEQAPGLAKISRESATSMALDFVWPDGRSGHVVLQCADDEGFAEEVAGVLRQVTQDLQDFLQRQNNHFSLQRTRILQQALLRAGEAILAAEDMHELLQKSCQQLIDSGIFIACWVARPGVDACMDALAYAGWSAPNALQRRWPVSADVPEGQTVGARAWRANSLVVQQDYLSDPLIQSWRAEALDYGWRAAAALPIAHDGQRWAVLAVIGDRPHMFSRDICDVLQQVARLVGHGLDELVLKQKLAEEKMQLTLLAAQDAAMRRYQSAVMKIQRDLLDRAAVTQMFPDLLRTLVQETNVLAAYITLPDPEKAQIGNYFIHCDHVGLRSALESFTDQQNALEWPVAASLIGQFLHHPPAQIHPLGYPVPLVNSLFLQMNPHLQKLELVSRLWVIAATDDSRPMAILGVFSENPQHFTEAVQQLYGQLANSIGLALRQDEYQKTIEEARQKLEKVAFYDPLTGLANRRLLESQLEQAMARHQRQDEVLAVCMLDLDRFKPINDEFGHEAGDQVLVTLGHRLAEVLRKNDMVGRFGGDEFVILLESVQNQDDLYQILRKIENVVTSPMQLQSGQSVRVGLSIGVSIYAGGDKVLTPEELLHQADLALYESKHHKQDRDACWMLHQPSTALERAPLAQRLLASGQLLVLYQPVWDARSNRVAGMESLARLRAEDGRILTPREFLPQLRGGNLCHLTQRMLAQSLEDLKSLGEVGENLWVSVNIDPQSLNKPCIRQIRQIILDSGLDPARIILEILEGSDFLERNSALELLRQIRALGVRLALDDVGSAYASLLRLKDLPVDEIKLDQGFVRTLATRPEDLHFVLAVRDLAQGLEVELVVEGVENEAVMDAMMTLNIPLLQGRHIARPMPIIRLRSWLQRKQPLRKYPATMLGIYAAQMASHNLLFKMARQNPHLMQVETLSQARLCPIHDYLQNLELDDQKRLMRHHQLYHRELGSLLRQLAEDRDQADWIAWSKAQETFLHLLRNAWQEQEH
ncbi:EAL domain-containing protein [Acidithiobacillus montserratensis]|uniref:EAL domain-containing protein n=1 Tax=Acidithiobacillus montserratensis TaxID=2729135 RepID=A0ACD5HGC8_9PROT|nr:EAL domain-containing protein [Acidithiobacillus montserratensis]MBN2679029.1 EAL domain-containing protein [Acidithiobacillaceae bacterium]MBU2746855.1 EAL domain-containing protein [Acidithiobacillus montserratensis]